MIKQRRPQAVQGSPFWDSRNSSLLLGWWLSEKFTCAGEVKAIIFACFYYFSQLFLNSRYLLRHVVIFLSTRPSFFHFVLSFASLSCWCPLASPYAASNFLLFLYIHLHIFSVIFSSYCTLSFWSSIFISFIVCFLPLLLLPSAELSLICWKFRPSQRPPSSISLDPGRKLSNFWSSFGKCPVWCYPPICTWVFLVIFWSGVSI